MARFHLSEDMRNQLTGEIRDAASWRQMVAVNELIEWAEQGMEDEPPVSRSLSQAARADLIDDLEWIFQSPVRDGWLTSVYDRRFVRRARKNRADFHRRQSQSSMKALRDLLPSF